MSPARPWLPRSSAPPEMIPGADPGRDLHEDHVREVGPVAAVLAERHRVDVALQQRRGAEALGQPVGDRIAVPAGHDRRVDRAPRGDLDRPGTPIAAPSTSARRVPGLGEQRVEGLLDPVQHRLRPVGDPQRRLELGQRDAREVADREPPVARAQVRGQDHADALVEGQRRRTATAARRAGLGLLDQQRGREQDADALHDRRAREARDVHDVVAGQARPSRISRSTPPGEPWSTDIAQRHFIGGPGTMSSTSAVSQTPRSDLLLARYCRSRLRSQLRYAEDGRRREWLEHFCSKHHAHCSCGRSRRRTSRHAASASRRS